MDSKDLLKEFIKNYSSKYNIDCEDKIGEGQYAYVYKGQDVDRNVNVAIKIYKEGTPPFGSERGWNVTSRLFHPQIARTTTIERINDYRGNAYKAVISDYIEGKTVEQLGDELDICEEEKKQILVKWQVFEILPSVLSILKYCHEQGVGHGDLHPGNVIVNSQEIMGRKIFNAILIDFDNASINNAVFAATEEEKMEKDGRTFFNPVMGVGTYLLDRWEYKDEVIPITTNYTSIKDIETAFCYVIQYCESINDKSFSKDKTLKILMNLMTASLTGFSPKPVIDCLREISQKANKIDEFNDVYRFSIEPGTIELRGEATITEISGNESNFYEQLFQKKK